MSKFKEGLADYSSTMPLFSTAFWVAWITVIYSGDTIVLPATSAYETTATAFSISTAVLGVTLIAAGALGRQAARVIESERAMYVVALICSIGTIGVSFEGAIAFPLFAASSAATGFATALISLRCIALYAEVDTKKAAITSCLSLVVGLFIYSFASMTALYYGAAGTLCLEATMPLFAVFFAFIPLRREAAVKDDADMHLSPAFWRLVAFMALIALSVSSIRGIYPKLMSAEAFSASRCAVEGGLLLMAFGIIALVARKPRGFAFGTLFYWLFVGSALLVAPAIATGIDSPLLGALASLANGLLLLMAWNFLARVSYCSGMSSVRVFGFGFGVTVLGVTLGFVVGDLIAGGKYANETLIAIILLGACLFAAVFLLREQDVNSCMAPTKEMLMGLDEEDAQTASIESGELSSPGSAPCKYADREHPCPMTEAHSNRLNQYVGEMPTYGKNAHEHEAKRGKFLQKCDAIAEQYGLTARESEVFELLAKHLEAQAIADELFISFNTTRTHIRKIYAKLDVHSRRELTELIDSYELD